MIVPCAADDHGELVWSPCHEEEQNPLNRPLLPPGTESKLCYVEAKA
jgi:hypothetical protein